MVAPASVKVLRCGAAEGLGHGVLGHAFGLILVGLLVILANNRKPLSRGLDLGGKLIILQLDLVVVLFRRFLEACLWWGSSVAGHSVWRFARC